MPAVTVTLTREAHTRLVDLAARERRTLYAQAGVMLERLLLAERESATEMNARIRRQAGRAES